MSGMLCRFELWRTPAPLLGPEIGLRSVNSQRIAWLIAQRRPRQISGVDGIRIQECKLHEHPFSVMNLRPRIDAEDFCPLFAHE
jgi:hypothetical protein